MVLVMVRNDLVNGVRVLDFLHSIGHVNSHLLAAINKGFTSNKPISSRQLL